MEQPDLQAPVTESLFVIGRRRLRSHDGVVIFDSRCRSNTELDTGAVMKRLRAQAVKNQRERSTKGVKKAPAAFQLISRDGGPDDLEGVLGLLVDRTWIQCACFGDRSIVAGPRFRSQGFAKRTFLALRVSPL